MSDPAAACPQPDCICTHSHGCYKGWIDEVPPRVAVDADGREAVYEQTKPCPVCYPQRAEIVASSGGSVAAGARLRSQREGS